MALAVGCPRFLASWTQACAPVLPRHGSSRRASASAQISQLSPPFQQPLLSRCRSSNNQHLVYSRIATRDFGKRKQPAWILSAKAARIVAEAGHDRPSKSSTQVLAPHIKSRALKAVKAPEESETERELPVLPVLQKVMQDKDWPREDIFDCTDGFILSSTGVSGSGLFQAIETAYSGHYDLHLRPDDIVLAIAQVSFNIRTLCLCFKKTISSVSLVF